MAETNGLPRRHVLRGSMGLMGAAALGTALPAAAQAATTRPVTAPAATPRAVAPATGDITVTLLGTGSPGPNPDRFSAATLVEAGGLKFIFDTGRGLTIRLRQLGVMLGDIDATFITHFHSDHLSGLADFWMTGYIQTAYASRKSAMLLVGPEGTRSLARNMRRAFIEDINIRLNDEKVPEVATTIEADDFREEGVVFERDGVTITTFAVNHGPLIPHCYGYRLDYAGRSVLISGDTKYDPNVVTHGQGVDLLVHEVCSAEASVLGKFNNQAVMNHHTSPQDAGRVFAAAAPRMAAYTHIIQLTDLGATTTPDLAQIDRLTRTTYAGPLEIGNDLTRFAIGEKITVQHWDPATQAYLA